MWQRLLQSIFPTVCFVCTKPGLALCKQCVKHIGFSNKPTGACFLYAIYDYNHPLVARAIKSLKYYRKESLARALSTHAADHILEILHDHIQTTLPTSIVFVPIPQHRNRSWERGFNPSNCIAKWLSKTIPTIPVDRVLTKYRYTQSQTKTNTKKHRLENLVYSMRAKPCNPDIWYVIIDDVITTGATALEAKRALVEAGATHVLAIGLTHSNKGYYKR